MAKLRSLEREREFFRFYGKWEIDGIGFYGFSCFSLGFFVIFFNLSSFGALLLSLSL